MAMLGGAISHTSPMFHKAAIQKDRKILMVLSVAAFLYLCGFFGPL